MHHRLRDYSWLQKSLQTAMEEYLKSVPVYLKLEARYSIYTEVCLSVIYMYVCTMQ